MIDILRKFISLSHKVALAATIRLFSIKIFLFRKVVKKSAKYKTNMPYNRKTYYYLDNITNNVAQYKFQNYN